jgi:TPP-dependent pyruvate/acetoin dehydrogenase alpha subunit
LGQEAGACPSCKVFTDFLLAAYRSTGKILQSDVDSSELARDNFCFSSVVTVVKDVLEKPKKSTMIL